MKAAARLLAATSVTLVGLAGGCGEQQTKAAPAPPLRPCSLAQRPLTPDLPTRDEILAQMRCIRTDVLACGPGASTVLQLDYAIAGKTGRAELVRLWTSGPGSSKTSASEQTTRCVQRALGRARFAPFGRDVYNVSYPYAM